MRESRGHQGVGALIPGISIVMIIIIILILVGYRELSQVTNEFSMQQLKSSTENIQLEIGNELEKYVHALGTFEKMVEKVPAVGEYEKEKIVEGLLGFLEEYEELFGTWIMIEPEWVEEYEQYKNTVLHDEDGRFAPYFSRADSGIYYQTMVSHKKEAPYNYFYTKPMESKKTYITPATTYEFRGQLGDVISLCIPLNVGEEVMGIVGMDIEIHELEKKIREYTVYDTGYAILFDQDYTVLAHPNEKFIGINPYTLNMVTEDERDGIEAAVKGDEFEVVRGYVEWGDIPAYKTFKAIQISPDVSPYIVQLVVPMSEVDKGIVRLRIGLLTFGMLAIILFSLGMQQLVINHTNLKRSEIEWMKQIRKFE